MLLPFVERFIGVGIIGTEEEDRLNVGLVGVVVGPPFDGDEVLIASGGGKQSMRDKTRGRTIRLQSLRPGRAHNCPLCSAEPVFPAQRMARYTESRIASSARRDSELQNEAVADGQAPAGHSYCERSENPRYTFDGDVRPNELAGTSRSPACSPTSPQAFVGPPRCG
jgi:hypothetical protein